MFSSNRGLVSLYINLKQLKYSIFKKMDKFIINNIRMEDSVENSNKINNLAKKT
jgi:hypothetical protein